MALSPDPERSEREKTALGFSAAGEKRFAVRVHVERTVSWDHSKLGGTY